MQFIDEHDFEETVDIFDMVLKLRENRPLMVQTEVWCTCTSFLHPLIITPLSPPAHLTQIDCFQGYTEISMSASIHVCTKCW